ncbi:MAG: OmpA family protein [Limnospira sp.]
MNGHKDVDLKSHQPEEQLEGLVDLLVEVLSEKSDDRTLAHLPQFPEEEKSPVEHQKIAPENPVDHFSHPPEDNREVPLLGDRDNLPNLPVTSSELVPESEPLLTERLRLIEVEPNEFSPSEEKWTDDENADTNSSDDVPSDGLNLKQTVSNFPEGNGSDTKIQRAEELPDPFDALQDLLLGSKLSEFEEITKTYIEGELPRLHEKIDSTEQKLRAVQEKFEAPDAIFQLLVPAIMEILEREFSASKQEIISSIVPVIDEIIASKKRQNKSGMIDAIADLLPGAISQHIINSPEEVARALAPEIAIAIREQRKLDRDAIANALAPEMGRAIKEQIRLERDAMVDALYPVIGNTISKYLTEAIQNINQKVANALSVEGVTRKVRAKFQGVSEAELILQESMPFSIQAIFLVHKSSGLIISDVQTSGSYYLESDMIGGMLTAIRSFVNDCIVRSDDYSELNEIEYGASKIILEVAGYCYLAVVMTGEPTQKFIEKMRKTMGTIILDYGDAIENFDGDRESIPAAVNQLLEKLIQFPVENKFNRLPMALIGLGVLMGLAVLVPWGYFSYQNARERHLEIQTAEVLDSTPELSIYKIGVNVKGDRLKLTGKVPNERLRNLAETLALSTAPDREVDNQLIAVDVPPDPLETAEEVERLTALFNELPSILIQTHYSDRQVAIDGQVRQIKDAHQISEAFKKIPGVQSVFSTLKVDPVHIENRIYFDGGSAKLNPKDTAIITRIKEVLDRYPRLSLKIIGHTDVSGNAAKNQQLALNRAEAVRDALTEQGIDPNRLEVVGNPEPPTDVASHQPFLLGRTVVFEIIERSGE